MGGGPFPPLAVVTTWKPNYKNPETRGWEIVILVSVLLAFTYIVVALRLWARFIISKSPGIDDVLIVFNLIPLTGLTVALSLAFRWYGFDRHVWDNPLPVLLQSRQITMALEQIYMLSTVTTKISILLFYRRLGVGAVTHRFLYCVYAAIAFVLGYFIVFTLTLWFHCRPISAFWLQVDILWNAKHKQDYTCINEPANLIAASTISVVQDFIVCGMPLVLFRNIRIPRRQKIVLAAVFGVGFVLCICGVLRVVYTIPIYYHTYDMTWESYPAWIWFAIESHLAVMCASAPALKVFFKDLNVSNISASWRTPTKRQNGTDGRNGLDYNEAKNGGRTLDTVDKKYPTPSQFAYDASESSEQLTERYRPSYLDDGGSRDIEMGSLKERQDFHQEPRRLPEEIDRSWLTDSTSRSRHGHNT
ncbi:hypothetical protein P152DRAFT_514656 [Eremomyces bilateralis CBS 781.70]|uniref:Rhodopsin domain-containing protein n=1 Tax=Eremomyces bilateralis CBS 781.70 TaxID=1392243 RepID=A0A6G1G237_9PEZI|nr:uncharacterized protein P152DRAFT_514656 [Eremomyces bilateralis CBS 781.70]KAF1811990.1 hypothetical protein P152DRAFT_514656 [Eremomyces bilateralis CBS 781.70]